MQQIRCLIIGKDRSITTLKIDALKDTFTWNKGLYTIPRDAVNISRFITEKGKEIKETYPELIYLEGTATPITSEEEEQDAGVQAFLERVILGNALKQVAAARSEWASLIFDYLKHPSKMILLVFILIIVAAVVGGLLFP